MRRPDRTLGLYLHVPFCRAKCAYCEFYSLARSEEKMDQYTDALIRHLKETAPMADGHTVDTVYIGGGTPSYLGPARIVKLLQSVKKYYHLRKGAEITMEANPDSASDVSALRAVRRAGVNRISLGMQSSDDRQLQAIGRIHTWRQTQSAVEAIRRAGIENLSLDLIYGLPDETAAQWEKTVNDALSLRPQHISCYALKLEEGTPLWQRRESLCLPDDDEQADRYLFTVDLLHEAGFEQYEISNFSLPGKESRHNLKYWHLEEYAGFGPGAHSDFGGVRYAYARDLDRYLAGDLILSESETVSTAEREREYLMLGLRTAEGISRHTFEDRYRRRFSVLEPLFELYEKHGLAARTEDGWRLTPAGFFVSNEMIIELEDALTEDTRRRRKKTAAGDFRIEREK